MAPLTLALLLLLLLAGPPASAAPPTCYSRMLGLSQEITRDFQLLQAVEPEVSSSQEASTWKLGFQARGHRPVGTAVCPRG